MTETPKEYGKLSTDQFKHLMGSLSELKKEDQTLAELVKSAPKDRINDLFDKDYYWAAIYELTFVEHLALLMLMLDKIEFLKETTKALDPTQYFMDNFEIDDDFENWGGGWQGAFSKQALIGVTHALQKTILSVLIYQKTIHTLVEEVRQGIDDSLFDAVRIDRSTLACPTFASRIAKAELIQDKHFFIRLRNALKGPSQKHMIGLQDLRFALFVLRDLGFDKLTDQQLENLLVHQLKVYPDRFEAKKNLRKQYNQSKKINHFNDHLRWTTSFINVHKLLICYGAHLHTRHGFGVYVCLFNHLCNLAQITICKARNLPRPHA